MRDEKVESGCHVQGEHGGEQKSDEVFGPNQHQLQRSFHEVGHDVFLHLVAPVVVDGQVAQHGELDVDLVEQGEEQQHPRDEVEVVEHEDDDD